MWPQSEKMCDLYLEFILTCTSLQVDVHDVVNIVVVESQAKTSIMVKSHHGPELNWTDEISFTEAFTSWSHHSWMWLSIQMLLCREAVAAVPQTARIAINIFLLRIFLLAIISFNIQHQNIKMKLHTLTSVALFISNHTECSAWHHVVLLRIRVTSGSWPIDIGVTFYNTKKTATNNWI